MKHFDLLIVDDERRYADMLAKRLELRGCFSQVCYSGREALEMIASKSFSIVILDLYLPDIYGTEVLRKIRADQSKVPVIVLTGHGTEKDRQECMQLGAYDFMHKPLDIEKTVGYLATSWEMNRHET